MADPKKMTDDEIDLAMAKKYGDRWDDKDLDKNDPLVIEFWKRTFSGY